MNRKLIIPPPPVIKKPVVKKPVVKKPVIKKKPKTKPVRELHNEVPAQKYVPVFGTKPKYVSRVPTPEPQKPFIHMVTMGPEPTVRVKPFRNRTVKIDSPV